MIFSAHEEVNSFKSKHNAGELVVGTWINAVKDPVIARILASTGLDYMLIDAEHSGQTMATITDTCSLARECGLYPMVRPIEPNDLKLNGRLIDAGAMGLVVPHIDSAKQAQAIVNSIKFFNGGTRGYCAKTAASCFRKMTEDLMRRSDEETTIVVQFESVAAVEEADEILAIPGIDVAIIGRGDLAHDMGLSGKPTDDRVSVQVEKVYEAARRQGKAQGLLCNDLDGALKWLGKGITFLTYGSEVGWLQNAYSTGLKAIREAGKQ